MIFALNASRSPGLREVITPWSTTTWEFSHFAPAGQVLITYGFPRDDAARVITAIRAKLNPELIGRVGI
jgi:hypothetical protein